MKSEALTAATIAKADCVVILTDHRIVDYAMVQHAARAIVDTRNAIAGHHANVLRLGAPSGTALRMPVRVDESREAKVVA
jgi:UDP-N-acetyl-D-glucosamine dehydrogenase